MNNDNSVFAKFSHWLISDLGIQRDYAANLRSLNKKLFKHATGSDDFIQNLYDRLLNSSDPEFIEQVCQLLVSLVSSEQSNVSSSVKLSKRYLDDCKSALRKFKWFLIKEQYVRPNPPKKQPLLIPNDIVWSSQPRKDMNIDQRLISQDRLNTKEDKPTNFPIRLIDQIANNADKWAAEIGLPTDHPAYTLKGKKEAWLDNSINNIVFLIEGDKQVVFSDISKIGSKTLDDGKKAVYIQLLNNEIHQVMSRSTIGITPMILTEDDDLKSIALDHVYRMEDVLNDLGDAFPFLRELTSLFRKLNKGNIRGAETRQAVRDHIHTQFLSYADKLEDMLSDLNKIGRICALEAMYHKDNLDKH